MLFLAVAGNEYHNATTFLRSAKPLYIYSTGITLSSEIHSGRLQSFIVHAAAVHYTRNTSNNIEENDSDLCIDTYLA